MKWKLAKVKEDRILHENGQKNLKHVLKTTFIRTFEDYGEPSPGELEGFCKNKRQRTSNSLQGQSSASDSVIDHDFISLSSGEEADKKIG